jgi:drug/metabolite transporter (DMT)-like permease
VLAPVFNGKVTITLGALEGNLFYVFSMVGALAHVFLAKSVGHRVKPVVFTFWFFLFGTASFIPLMLNELRLHPIITLSPFAIFSVYFGIILSSALAYFLFSYGESKVHVQELGLFSYIDPVAAVILASWILGEHPDNFFVIGSLLVSGGIYIAEGRIPWHPIHKHKSYRRQDILVVPAYQSDTKQN